MVENGLSRPMCVVVVNRGGPWTPHSPCRLPCIPFFQIISPMSQNGFIYVVLYAESIPHSLEAIRKDSGPVFKDLLFLQESGPRIRVPGTKSNDFGMLLGCFLDDFDMILEGFWNDFGMIYGWFSGYFGMNLGWFWDDFGMFLGWFWHAFGMILVWSWGWFWDDLGMLWGWFWGDFGWCLYMIYISILYKFIYIYIYPHSYPKWGPYGIYRPSTHF